MAMPQAKTSGATADTLVGPVDNSSQNDTIGFVSSGPVTTSDFKRPENLKALLQTMKPPEDKQHDIADYLRRPVRIQAVQLKATDTVGQFVWNASVTEMIRQNPCMEMIRQKLAGFMGITAQCHVKVVINANPNEAGIYQLCYAPYMMPDTDQYSPITDNLPKLEYRIPFTSGLPSTLINFAKHSERELAVGYIAPDLFYDLTNAGAQWGHFYLQCLSPTSSTDTGASVNATMYCYFTDVLTYGATSNSAMKPTPGGRVESGVVEVKPQDERSEAVNPVAGGTKISQLAEDLSKFPLLQAFAPEAGPILATGANIARAFGLSKPNAEAEHKRIALTPYGQPANWDGTSNAMKLSGSSDNQVAPLPIGPTDADELSIKYLTSEPNYLMQFEWKKDNADGIELATIPVEPNCTLGVTQAAEFDYFPTKLYYVSSLFREWRGSLKFTFHVAATKFHSGRLRFSLTTPGPRSLPSFCDNNYNYSKIVDIRDGLSFTINVPYLGVTPWKKVPFDVINVGTLGPWFQDASALPCQLHVSVESALKTSPASNPNINILVFVSAGEDFQLACPGSGLWSFYNHWNAPPAPSGPGRVEADMRTDGEDDIPVISLFDDQVVDRNISTLACQVTNGELVTSLRQVIKRYQATGYSAQTAGCQLLQPFVIPWSGYTSQDPNNFQRDFLNKVQVLYRFWRGSKRHLITGFAPNQTILVSYNTYSTESADYTDGASWGISSACHELANADGNPYEAQYLLNGDETVSFPVTTNLQGSVELQTPFYTPFPFCAYGSQKENAITPTRYGELSNAGIYPLGFVVMGPLDATPRNLMSFHAAGDDFHCGFALGAPICRRLKTFATYK